MISRTVTLDTADGPMSAFEAVPDSARAAVIVIPEAFGVNSYIESVVERLAAAEIHGLALDLFHRAGGGTADYGDFEKVIGLFAGLDSDAEILTDVDAGIDHMREVGFADQKIGIVGFCFGGRVSFLAALNRPIGAGVGFYGGGIASAGRLGSYPALIEGAPTLQVPWLGLFGDQDESIPVADVRRLEAELKRAPVATEVVLYPGVGHGFHCDQRDSYAEQAANDAWDRGVAWFARHLR